MDRSAMGRFAVSGLAAGILFLVIAVPFALGGERFQISDFLPIALYQAIWCFVEGWVVQKHRPISAGRAFQDRSGVLPLATALAAILIVAVAVRETVLSGPAGRASVIAGYLIGGSGILLRQISIVSLGPFFRDAIDLREDHEHISSGLYAFCRHPAEIGFALAMAGLLFISGSAAAAILFGAVLVPLLLIRMNLENRLLRDRFGV